MCPLLEGIIHPSQATFVPNRSIGDNVIINHEIMYYLNRKSGKTGLMAIKIDLAKAYDRIEWTVLKIIMLHMGFDCKFVDLIQECISSTNFSILLNGVPFGFFSAERGLRQGDPMSPALFTIFSDLLSRMLEKAVAEGKISGVKVTRTSPKISHLMYVDDLVIYYKATEAEATAVHSILQQYCQWTGQAINWNKSSVHFSKNVSSRTRHHLCCILHMTECNHHGKYLGHSFCRFTSKDEAFKGVMEKISNKLAGWKAKCLSMAGRTTLIKAVMQAIPTYTMQFFVAPKKITDWMDRKFRNFFWGKDDTNLTTCFLNHGRPSVDRKL